MNRLSVSLSGNPFFRVTIGSKLINHNMHCFYSEPPSQKIGNDSLEAKRGKVFILSSFAYENYEISLKVPHCTEIINSVNSVT